MDRTAILNIAQPLHRFPHIDPVSYTHLDVYKRQDQIVTVSIGVAVRQPQEPLLDLIQRADMALYDAKNSGRNRVRLAPGTLPLPAMPG